MDYFHTIETALLKYLIKYANINLEIENDIREVTTTTVAKYIFDELMVDEINFMNEIYAEIFLIAFEKWRTDKTLNQSFFVNHESPYISKTVTDIIASKHELSILYEKQNIVVEQESRKLSELIPNNIIIYKSRSLNKLAKELEKKLKTLSDEKEIDELLKNLLRIKNALKEMSALTNRIIP